MRELSPKNIGCALAQMEMNMLEAAKPFLIMTHFGGTIEVPTTIWDKVIDLLHFRKPSNRKYVQDERRKLPVAGDKITFKRYSNKT